MYWNELNPIKRNVLFKFDGSDLKKHETPILVQFKTHIINFINLFFSSSNIHGFNHLTDENRHFTEKYVLKYYLLRFFIQPCTFVYTYTIYYKIPVN